MSASKKKKSNKKSKKNNVKKVVKTNAEEKKNINKENVNENTDKELKNKENINESTDKELNNKKDIKETTDKKNDISETENKKDEKKPQVEEVKKDIAVLDKKEETLENKKSKVYIFISIISIILVVLIFSTCFALININNKNFIKGVSVKDIEISGLSKDDAKNKINEAIKLELMAEINLKYGEEYQIQLKPEQIEFKYNIDEALDKAYQIGRDGNIVKNNYTLIFSNFFGNDVKANYTYNEELLNQFIDDINAKIPGVVVNPTYYIEESKLIVNKGTDGIQVNKQKLKEEILNSIISREVDKVKQEGYNEIIEIPIDNVKAEKIDMSKIYSEIHTEPKDAYFETNPYKIYPDVEGVDLAISVEEAQNLVNSEEKDEYSFDLKITKAEKTVDDLGIEAFPYLISSFTTPYNAGNVNRTTNLRIAAQKINGKVLMPGEEFSYNKVVGKRTVEEGYKDAQIYADGGVVDGLAGGICQISSTLYNVVLLANLQVTERRNHTYTTSYVAAGKDATVVWGTTDFKFVNSRSYPIKIEASVGGGIVSFKIHGIKEEPEYEVRILPVTTQSIPYTTSYVQDPTLAPGQQIISQSGHAGYKVTTYKELRLNGEVVSKEVISNDTYSPMRTIIRIGPQLPVTSTDIFGTTIPVQ